MSGEDLLDGDFIILEPEGPPSTLDSALERVFGDITRTSAAKQLAIGGVGGWFSGYLANKVGKIAAVSLAGSILVIQVAQYNGYITVNWTRVQHAMTSARAKAKAAMMRNRNGVVAKVQTFYEENFFLASGFTAGFLVGFFV